MPPPPSVTSRRCRKDTQEGTTESCPGLGVSMWGLQGAMMRVSNSSGPHSSHGHMGINRGVRVGGQGSPAWGGGARGLTVPPMPRRWQHRIRRLPISLDQPAFHHCKLLCKNPRRRALSCGLSTEAFTRK